MRKAITAFTTLAVILAAPAMALADSAPGIGSNVDGRDSAGGAFSFAFDALKSSVLIGNNGHKTYGPVMYSLGDSFNCTGTKGAKPEYAFNTIGPPTSPKYPDNSLQPFPAVNDSYQAFHYVFSIKYQSAKVDYGNPAGNKSLGTVTVSISGRIKQISGPVGGPGKAIANGTIGMHVSGACHTGTLKWSAKGPIVNPNPDA